MSRRRFLALGAGTLGTSVLGAAGLAACSDSSPSANSAVAPTSSRVLELERARQNPGQRIVTASLDAGSGIIDLGGRAVQTWSYNSTVPGPLIRLTAGEQLRVDLRNSLPQPTTVHWHGIALRNDMDGVPALTQDQIDPGAEFRYEFTAPHPGTYIYHPHVGTQLDRGLYGALIVDDPAEPGRYDQELVVLFDDWIDGTGRDPDQVLADLKANGMSGSGGMAGMGGHDQMQMPQSDLLGGDAGDVSYPIYVANGRISTIPETFATKPGNRIRLRLINISGDTAFRVGVPGTPMTVTHTDGFPVNPSTADAVLLGMGERLDAVVEVPERSVPLLGLAEGKGGVTQVLLSTGGAANTDTRAGVAQLGRRVLSADALTATDAVQLDQRRPDVTHRIILGGPGDGYLWTINGQPYDPARGLAVTEGQRVRLSFVNDTTMFHPMHLHGHTFQVRGAGARGPRKDTLSVLPGQTVDVDFDADNPGQWLAHCHNIYHGEAGMMTFVSYRQ